MAKKKLGEVEKYYMAQFVTLWTKEIRNILESRLHTAGASSQYAALKAKGVHVKRIRSYTKDIIFMLTTIHDDIYNTVGETAISFDAKEERPVIECMLQSLCEKLFDAIYQTLKDMETISPYCSLQIQAELIFFTKAMNRFFHQSEEASRLSINCFFLVSLNATLILFLSPPSRLSLLPHP
jgi:hypothetical protein